VKVQHMVVGSNAHVQHQMDTTWRRTATSITSVAVALQWADQGGLHERQLSN